MSEFDRIYAKLNKRLRAEAGESKHGGTLPVAAMKMPKRFSPFIRELKRLADRVRVEVDGRRYWIIYDEDPRWEEIAA